MAESSFDRRDNGSLFSTDSNPNEIPVSTQKSTESLKSAGSARRISAQTFVNGKTRQNNNIAAPQTNETVISDEDEEEQEDEELEEEEEEESEQVAGLSSMHALRGSGQWPARSTSSNSVSAPVEVDNSQYEGSTIGKVSSGKEPSRSRAARKSWQSATNQIIQKRRAEEFHSLEMLTIMDKVLAREAIAKEKKQQKLNNSQKSIVVRNEPKKQASYTSYISQKDSDESEARRHVDPAVEAFVKLKLVEWDKDENGTFSMEEVQLAMAQLKEAKREIGALKMKIAFCGGLMVLAMTVLAATIAVILHLSKQTDVADGSNMWGRNRGSGFDELVSTAQSASEKTFINILDFDEPSDQWVTDDNDLRQITTVSFSMNKTFYLLAVAELVRVDSGSNGTNDKVDILTTGGYQIRMWEQHGQIQLRKPGFSIFQNLDTDYDVSSSRRLATPIMDEDSLDETGLMDQDEEEFDEMFEPPVLRRAKGGVGGASSRGGATSSSKASKGRGSSQVRGIGVGYRHVYVGHRGGGGGGGGGRAQRSCSCSATLWIGGGAQQVNVEAMHQWATPAGEVISSSEVITELEVYGDSVCMMSVWTENGEESFLYRKENPTKRYYQPLPHGDKNIQKVMLSCGGQGVTYSQNNRGSDSNNCPRCYVPPGDRCGAHCLLGECYIASGRYNRCNSCRHKAFLHSGVLVVLVAALYADSGISQLLAAAAL